MSENAEPSLNRDEVRELPPRIVIPPIKGEMVHLRPATIEDLPCLDKLDAYCDASRITGKDWQAERAAVHAWVRRSVAWSEGLASSESGVGDPEARRTIAWAVLTDADHDDDGRIDAAATGNVIGMVFLIDIDGWARSARIQVLLGKDYRGRGYSRDAMPRVMTYGYAPEPAGLGMHRIWVAVPEKNTRSLSVYQSLGFMQTGTSRDALWDAENGKYQDLIVMDTLVDEYDPIRSLDAFGMHVIEDNPGVQEALAAREHSVAIRQKKRAEEERQTGRTNQGGQAGQTADAAGNTSSNMAAQPGLPDGSAASGDVTGAEPSADGSLRNAFTPSSDGRSPVSGDGLHIVDGNAKDGRAANGESSGGDAAAGADDDGDSSWPYGQSDRKPSKNAWWRILGRGRKRDMEDE